MLKLLFTAILALGFIQEPALKENGSIEGAIVLADSSAGLAGALIVVSGIPSRPEPNRIEIQAVSGKDGHFQIQGIPPGNYTLRLRAAGFVRSVVDRTPDFGSFTIQSRQEIRGVILTMAPETRLFGHVVDPEGRPAPGARIELQSTGGTLITAVSTNDAGEFLASVPPGEAIINAIYRAYAKTYFPGVVDIRSAMRLNVHEGENISGLDFRVQERSFVHVSGTVIPDPSQTATVTGVDVFLKALDSDKPSAANLPQLSLKPLGGGILRFDFANVEPGRYTIFAVTQNDSGTSSLGRTSVEVGTQDLNGVIVNAHPGMDVRGQITVAGNATLRDSVVLIPALEADEIQLPQKVRANLGFGDVRLNSDGAFVISNVPEGQYVITIVGLPADTVIIDAQVGSAPLAGGTITIGSLPPARLRLTLGAGGIVRGTVMDAGRMVKGGAPILLLSDRSMQSSRQQIRTATSDAAGNFELRSVPPGNYSILAFGSGRPPDVLNAETLERYDSFRVPVSVSSGANIVTTVTSVP